MRLVCPHCDAAYDVPPALLAGRRAVRCARCGREWTEQTEPADGVADAAVPAEVPSGPTPRAPISVLEPMALPLRPRGAAVRFGWAGSMLLLALGAWSVVTWRADVMHAWPPSGRLYSALGLTAGR